MLSQPLYILLQRSTVILFMLKKSAQRSRYAHFAACAFAAWVLSGCSSPIPYVSGPTGQAEARHAFESRQLNDASLKQFLLSVGKNVPEKDQAWDFETLALVSTFFNPDMAVSEAHWREALASRDVLLSPKAFQLEFLAEHHTLTEPGRPNPWSWSIGFEFVLPDADRRAAKAQLASDQIALARLEVASSSWRSRSVLRSVWIEYFAAQRHVELTRQLYELSRTHLIKINQRVDAGLQGHGDLMAAQDFLKNVQMDMAEAKRMLSAQEAQLRSAMHLPPSASPPPSLQDWDWESLSVQAGMVSKAQLQELALINRLDLREAEARYAIADAKLRLEVAQQYPEISLKPGYEWDQGDHRLKLGVGLPIALPAAHHAAVDTASAERDTQGLILLALQEKILQELAHAQSDCDATRDKLNDVRQARDLAQQALKHIQIEIRLGEADPTQAFELETKLMTMKKQTAEAERLVQKSLAHLEDVLQQPILMISMRGAQ